MLSLFVTLLGRGVVTSLVLCASFVFALRAFGSPAHKVPQFLLRAAAAAELLFFVLRGAYGSSAHKAPQIFVACAAAEAAVKETPEGHVKRCSFYAAQ